MTELFVKQLTTLDFSYLCPEQGIVGETWLVDVSLQGELDEQGMVFDFGHVKKQIKALLDTLSDHRLLVPIKNERIHVKKEESGGLAVRMQLETSGTIECKAPAQAILLIDSDAVTSEYLTPYLERAVLAELPDNVSGVTLRLYPESIQGAFYHYSHGLKKHLGDCQRIAHGHRSAIEIYVDNRRVPDQEQAWADDWKNIYIVTREDLQRQLTLDGVKHLQIGYTSDHGYFEFTAPEGLCYFVDTDSTVELLAEHIARVHKEKNPGKVVRVVVYEGFNKGATAHH